MGDMDLTPLEKDIMSVLWEQDQAIPRREIFRIASANKKISLSSVSAVLSNLIKRDLVEVAGFVQIGKAIGRTYIAKVSEEQYIVSWLIAHGKSVTDFLRFCLEKDRCTREDVIAASQIIKEYMQIHDIT